jgi:hypothetical protein
MIRNIINFFVILALFFIGSEYFPEHIYAQDTKTLIIATLTMFIIGTVAGIIVVALLVLIPPIGCFAILAIIFIVPIELILTSHYINGFEINGFWTYALLSFVISLFSLRVNATYEKK